jgi:hypothetical protein
MVSAGGFPTRGDYSTAEYLPILFQQPPSLEKKALRAILPPLPNAE